MSTLNVNVIRPVSITHDQYLFAQSLSRAFRRFDDGQRAQLADRLEREDKSLHEAIHATRILLDTNQFVEVPRVGTPVKITDLETRYQWTPDTWQRQLLDALDGNDLFKKDGEVLASEIVTSLRNPTSPRFLTTAAIERLERMIEQKTGRVGGAELVIKDLKQRWVHDFFEAADRAGDSNEQISKDEIEKFLAANPDKFDQLALQNVAVMLHQIAQVTGEPNPFKLVARGTNLDVVRSSYVGSYDGTKLVSTCIAQAVTWSDLVRRGDLDRKDNFHRDQLLPKFIAADPKDYRKTGYDMGHLAAAADATTRANIDASFSLLNMAPQLPGLNRFSWRYLEASIRDLIIATNARAIVYTGALYLHSDGTPMTDEELKNIKVIGKDHKIAVPTHFFKTVLLQLPGHKITTLSYILPNTEPPKLPTSGDDCKDFVQKHRVSIADIEAKCPGLKLFDGVFPSELEDEIKTASNYSVAIPENREVPLDAADFLWANGTPPQDWFHQTTYDIDATAQLVATYMREIGGDRILDEDPMEVMNKALKNGIVSRHEARNLAVTFDLNALDLPQSRLAESSLANAMTASHDKQAVRPLNFLLTRIRNRVGALSTPPQ